MSKADGGGLTEKQRVSQEPSCKAKNSPSTRNDRNAQLRWEGVLRARLLLEAQVQMPSTEQIADALLGRARKSLISRQDSLVRDGKRPVAEPASSFAGSELDGRAG